MIWLHRNADDCGAGAVLVSNMGFDACAKLEEMGQRIFMAFLYETDHYTGTMLLCIGQTTLDR